MQVDRKIAKFTLMSVLIKGLDRVFSPKWREPKAEKQAQKPQAQQPAERPTARDNYERNFNAASDHIGKFLNHEAHGAPTAISVFQHTESGGKVGGGETLSSAKPTKSRGARGEVSTRSNKMTSEGRDTTKNGTLHVRATYANPQKGGDPIIVDGQIGLTGGAISPPHTINQNDTMDDRKRVLGQRSPGGHFRNSHIESMKNALKESGADFKTNMGSQADKKTSLTIVPPGTARGDHKTGKRSKEEALNEDGDVNQNEESLASKY